MLQPKSDTPIADEVPWSDGLTAYDKEHFTTYMRHLDTSADDASEEEMAHLILGIVPERARKAQSSRPCELDGHDWLQGFALRSSNERPVPAIHERMAAVNGAADAVAQMIVGRELSANR